MTVEWQQIESAPTEQRILAWDGHEILTLDWTKSTGWHQVSDSGRSSPYYPTHWRPLPVPPSREDVERCQDCGQELPIRYPCHEQGCTIKCRF